MPSTPNCCNSCLCQIILSVNEFDDAEEQFATLCTSEKRESVRPPRGFSPCREHGRVRSVSLCYSANQPLIPALLMWEVMLCVTLSFSHQCSLCLCLSLYISVWGTVAALWLAHCWDSLADSACWACLHGFMLLGCWLMHHLCSFNCLLFQPQAERNE